MNKCVHTEHCCRVHGCKYGDDGCPVWLGHKSQSHPCESCEVFDLNDVPKIRISEFKKRNDQFDEKYEEVYESTTDQE